jgi:hypothetical protein
LMQIRSTIENMPAFILPVVSFGLLAISAIISIRVYENKEF